MRTAVPEEGGGRRSRKISERKWEDFREKVTFVLGLEDQKAFNRQGEEQRQLGPGPKVHKAWKFVLGAVC